MIEAYNGLNLAAAAIGAALLTGSAAPAPDQMVQAALKTRLPKTVVTKVDCAKVKGLCEVTSGDNLFYVDAQARYLVIGRVYDLETRQDLTAARLLEMNPDLLVGGAAKANAAAAAGDAPGPGGARQVVRATPTKVDLSKLSRAGAIEWGRGGPAVTVFSDFHCGYCRALAKELARMDVRVIERPISVLGSREVANQVLCARDRAAAVHAAYAGAPIASKLCDTRGLDENEAFARAHGFTGTPVIVRADGAVIEGFRPAPALEAWLKGSAS